MGHSDADRTSVTAPAVSGEGARGRDPDYRFTLANERTLLAWLRTAPALVAAGVAVVQLAPAFGFTGARHVVGVALAALGATVAGGSLMRWYRVQRAMQRDEDLPPTRMPVLLAVALVVPGCCCWCRTGPER